MTQHVFKPTQPIHSILHWSLSVCVLAGSMGAPVLLTAPVHAATPTNAGLLTGDVRLTVNPANLRESLPIAGASRRVTMSFHGISIQDALRALARQGNFNVLIDESVTGDVSVDLNNVTIQNALDTLKSYGNLAYAVQGGNLVVAEATSPKGLSLKKTSTRIFALHHANATVVANFLNNSLFADRVQAAGGGAAGSSSGSSGTPGASMPVTADYQTNSLIVVGDPIDIKTVQEHLEVLDQPRQMKTWRLSQANVLDVATMLASSVFNEGQAILSANTSGGSSSSSTSMTSGNSNILRPSNVRVTMENISEGTGTSQSSQSSSSSSGGSSGGSGGSSGGNSLLNTLTIRGRVQQTSTVQISPNGPIILPDTRLNTLTLLGTAEQIATVESLIPVLDRKVPQVVLEASLVELSEDARKELGFNNGINANYFSSGTNNGNSGALINQAFSNAIGSITNSSTPLESLFRFTSSPLHGSQNFVYQINALVSKSKAKMLANPTVITTSDNETIISIVDEIIRSVTVTQGTNSATPTFSTNIGEAGIVLNILPKVGPNNIVSLRVRPVVSTVANTQQDRFGNVITLLSKREALAQNVQLKDGETFVLGGLVHNTNAESVTRSPLLSSLPIVGALGRNSLNSRHRTELVILITPHIMNDDSDVVRSNAMVPTSALVPKSMSRLQYAAQSGSFKNGTGKNALDNDAMIPVSWNHQQQPKTPSALPPLQPVHVIQSDSNLDHHATPAVPHASRIPLSGALQPDELSPASDDRMPLRQPYKTAASSPHVPQTHLPVREPHQMAIQPAPRPLVLEDAFQDIISSSSKK